MVASRAHARRLWALYDEFTLRHPLLAKIPAGAVLSLLGDTAAQGIERWMSDAAPPHDKARCARIVCWRAFLHTPFNHFYFNLVDHHRVFGPSRAWRIVFKKIAADQLIASPSLHFFFLPFMALCEGKPLAEAVQCGVTGLPSVMMCSWCVWPFIHLLTFGVIPLHQRVMWTNWWAMWWMAFLSVLSEQRRNRADV
eukprot:NODE_18736_length_879_cov_3.712766.p1 GENE.NODE_18736_length_879_cov_3.712766~~NODE_18736_length_879_cov_3.712766.p1  ORF type:complete len:196 (+),score=51.41 NODE_18736_length_879_cov_3.712766:118-705(+)